MTPVMFFRFHMYKLSPLVILKYQSATVANPCAQQFFPFLLFHLKGSQTVLYEWFLKGGEYSSKSK